jgi:hypothetical protein
MANVSIYGGFACQTWAYNGKRPRVAPSDAGFALQVDNVINADNALVVADMDFTAMPGTEGNPGESSIAIFASASSVTFNRVRAVAGSGRDAALPISAPDNLHGAYVANDGEGLGGGPTPGAAKVCACKIYGSSTGGKGGIAPAGTGQNGAATPMPASVAGRTGAGGTSTGAACAVDGQPGADGDARQGGSGATTFAAGSSKGWTPSAGEAGEAGNPGGGGGGGAGHQSLMGGGSGGCGGCGGAGGVGGAAGGSSIALLLDNATVTLSGVVLETGDAGNGGDGGVGGDGEGGGPGGRFACQPGRGGNGAGGGGGGGGTGGVSAAIVRRGGSVAGEPAATLGRKGSAGQGGAPGAGGVSVLGAAPAGRSGAAGLEGVSQQLLVIN